VIPKAGSCSASNVLIHYISIFDPRSGAWKDDLAGISVVDL
jgi:hypothetical protein